MSAPRQWWLNFYPISVHVFRTPEEAKSSSDRHVLAGLVRPETIHVREVVPENQQPEMQLGGS